MSESLQDTILRLLPMTLEELSARCNVSVGKIVAATFPLRTLGLIEVVGDTTLLVKKVEPNV